MKENERRELFRKKGIIAGCVVLAAALIAGGAYMYQINIKKNTPELVSYVDSWEDEISIGEDEVPLAESPNTTTKTSTETSTENVKMSKAATKTYTKTLPAVTTTSTKTETSGNGSAKVVTTVKTSKTEQYTKKSRIKKVTTKVTTTIKTTPIATDSVQVEDTSVGSGGMSLADRRVVSAYEKLGFTVKYNSSAPYSGHFDARSRTIILRRKDDTIYHELGHFVAFASGNTDKSAAFRSVYSSEKGKYTASNKSYVTKNAEEYFAESFKNYTLNPDELKQSRPKTYKAIAAAVSKITDDQVRRIQNVYGSIWK